MKGFIKSRMTTWMHIFKMSVRPGGEIPLEDLYILYGKKHNIKEEYFIQWLKDVKLKGKLDDWQIVEHDSEYSAEIKEEVEKKEEYTTNTKGDVVARQMSVEDVVQLSVRKAREVLPSIMDAKLLKFALAEAHPRANKSSLCQVIEKRLSELSLTPIG